MRAKVKRRALRVRLSRSAARASMRKPTIDYSIKGRPTPVGRSVARANANTLYYFCCGCARAVGELSPDCNEYYLVSVGAQLYLSRNELLLLSFFIVDLLSIISARARVCCGWQAGGQVRASERERQGEIV